jgi:plasmid stabilization system protein ParE
MKFGKSFLKNMLRLDYSLESKDDLIDIFENIKKDKPNVAKEYAQKLKEYMELLIANPKMGGQCKNKNVMLECRILVYKSHLIFYKVKENSILIIRIIHSKENYKQNF